MSYHDKFTAWYTCNKCKAKSSVEETDGITPTDLPKDWTRGSTNEHYCRKCSHSMNPKDLPTVLTFGKYRDLYISDVINLNPRYLLWAEENISWFFLTPDQKRAISKAISTAPNVADHYRQHGREPTYNSKDYQISRTGERVDYDTMTRMTSESRYDSELDCYHGYTEHQGQIIARTYHSDGKTTVHWGGPCGDGHYDEFGNYM